MTIQITLILISILLMVVLGLLIWVIRLTIKRRTITPQVTVVPGPNLVFKRQVFHRPKYANSKLKEREKETYLSDLLMHLELQKIYRQPDLSVAQLAKQVKIPKHYLSQIINEKMQCSFLDFINRYRVEEAKEKLQATDFQDLSILAIGKSVGFNAKSTFYAAFKKYTDVTPGDYRRAHIQKRSSEQI